VTFLVTAPTALSSQLPGPRRSCRGVVRPADL